MKLIPFLTTAALVLAGSAFTHGAIISATGAVTNMGSGFGTSLDNTINGVGLSLQSLTATHAATRPANSWVSAGILTGDITFTLGGLFTLDGFSFWNQNNGGPAALGTTGIQNVFISYSVDNVNFDALPGAPTSFAQATGNISPAQQFVTAPVSAKFVRFAVQSNYGDVAETGFAEVKFSGVPAVPEPGTALFGLALCGVAAARRRR